MARCKGCNAEIMWCRTLPGAKWIPVDSEPNPEGNLVISDPSHPHTERIAEVADLFTDADGQRTRYMPHHATCPDVEDFR